MLLPPSFVSYHAHLSFGLVLAGVRALPLSPNGLGLVLGLCVGVVQVIPSAQTSAPAFAPPMAAFGGDAAGTTLFKEIYVDRRFISSAYEELERVGRAKTNIFRLNEVTVILPGEQQVARR